MPPAPSEPEKYSIDEMMERLKGQAADPPDTAGGLVTRADGTQAIRMRKRKRRTEQPQREEAKRSKRRRMVQVVTGLVLLLLAAGVIAGAYVYANTAPYRKSITDAIADSTGAKVEFKLFRVSPASANADSIDLEWPEASALRAIRLHGVSAKLSPLSLFGTTLSGDEVSAREGSIFLQTPAADSPLPTSSARAAAIPVHFDRVSIPKCNFSLGDPLRPDLKILSTEASLRLDKPNNQTALLLYHGTAQIAGWPAFKIDRAVMELHDSETELTWLRLSDSHPKRGMLDLAGTIRHFSTTSPSTLKVKLDNFDFGELLGTEFGELIDATIDSRTDAGSNCLTFTPGSFANADLKIAFKNTLSTKADIKGFPFLVALARTLNDKWYESPSFRDATGLIHRNGKTVELRELNLESKSRMAIRANLAAAAETSLSGTMEVGIPEAVANLSTNGKIQAMLSAPREGYRWLNLKIYGTLTHPNDDFAALYVAAVDTSDADAEPPEPPAKAAAPSTDPQKAFDDITRPKDH